MTARSAGALVRAAYRRADSTHLSAQAAGAAFWLLMAVFPAGLVAVNVMGLLLPQEEVARAVGDYALAAPGTWGDLLAVQLQAVAAPSPGSLPVDLGLVILALWTVSTGMHALLRAIRSVSGLPREGFLLVRTLAVAVGMLVIAAVAVAAEVIDATTLTRSIIGVVVLVAVLIGLVALVYLASVGASAGWRGLLPGAVAAAVGLLIVGLLLNVYAAVSPNLALVYGTIAGVIVSMLTVWLSVCAVLIGAALNAEIPPRGVRT